MKLAIIEDRLRRLKQFQGFEINKQPNCVIVTENDFTNLVQELNKGIAGSLDDYDVIAVHRSALDAKARDIMKAHCAKKRKPLIFFSGGITYSIYKDADFPFLYLNSKEFYSANLRIFLDDIREGNSPNLFILQFGLQWKMSLLLGLRNNIAVRQSKQLMKDGGAKDIEIPELIRRVQDLQINDLIKEDLINDKTRQILTESNTALITAQQIDEIKLVIDQLINRML